jgi:AraC-like DNA-binding protein
MENVIDKPHFVTSAPSILLRNFINHYWLSLNNIQATHVVLPDGAVDIVIRLSGSSSQSLVYGTVTTATEISLKQNSHYLGIRFQPGQSRHFIKATAHELTNGCEPVDQLLSFSLKNVPDDITQQNIFALLDQLMIEHLNKQSPARSRIDEAIKFIELTHGIGSVNEATSIFGKSRRQLERVFLETVGVSVKSFSSIARFHHAAALLSQQFSSLADIAIDAGYSDQSHMTHEFSRIAKISPAKLAYRDVVFLQD